MSSEEQGAFCQLKLTTSEQREQQELVLPSSSASLASAGKSSSGSHHTFNHPSGYGTHWPEGEEILNKFELIKKRDRTSTSKPDVCMLQCFTLVRSSYVRNCESNASHFQDRCQDRCQMCFTHVWFVLPRYYLVAEDAAESKEKATGESRKIGYQMQL